MWGVSHQRPISSDLEVSEFSESCVRSDIAEIIGKMYTPRSESPKGQSEGHAEGHDRAENAVCREMIVNIQDDRRERVGFYRETITKTGRKMVASTTDLDSTASDCLSIPMVHLPAIGRRRSTYICECCRRSMLIRNSINRTRRFCQNCVHCNRHNCHDAKREGYCEANYKCSTLVHAGQLDQKDKCNQVSISEEEQEETRSGSVEPKISHSKSKSSVSVRKKTLIRRFITKMTSWHVSYSTESPRAKGDGPNSREKCVKPKKSRSSHKIDTKESTKISNQQVNVILSPSNSKTSQLDLLQNNKSQEEKDQDDAENIDENEYLVLNITDDIIPQEKIEEGSMHKSEVFTDSDVKKEDWPTTFWTTIFRPFHTVVSFVIAFFLELLRFILEGVLHPLFWRSLTLFSDHIFKPCLSTLFVGILEPTFALLQNITSSLKDAFLPISQCLGQFFLEVSTLCKACRLVEVNNYRDAKNENHCVP